VEGHKVVALSVCDLRKNRSGHGPETELGCGGRAGHSAAPISPARRRPSEEPGPSRSSPAARPSSFRERRRCRAFLGFLPLYAKIVGLNDAEIAIVLGSQLATAVVAKPIGGRLSDGLGRKPVIVIGLLLCAAALPLIFRSESLATFVIVAPLLGLGIAAVTPVTNALIADLASARRLGAAMGVFGTIWDIGEAAGPIIAGFLIVGLGYASTFDTLALVTVVVSIGVVVLVRDPKTAIAGQHPSARR